MIIRPYTPQDISEIFELFYNTVHYVNNKDYSFEQLHAWAPLEEKESKISDWHLSFQSRIVRVAAFKHQLIGFSDMTLQGHLDRLYVHKDWQRKGVASALLKSLEQEAYILKLPAIHTEASITALPFFLHQQFVVEKEQLVVRHSIQLKNYVMTKSL